MAILFYKQNSIYLFKIWLKINLHNSVLSGYSFHVKITEQFYSLVGWQRYSCNNKTFSYFSTATVHLDNNGPKSQIVCENLKITDAHLSQAG